MNCGLYGCTAGDFASEEDLLAHQNEIHNCIIPGCIMTFKDGNSRRSHVLRNHFGETNPGKSVDILYDTSTQTWIQVLVAGFPLQQLFTEEADATNLIIKKTRKT